MVTLSKRMRMLRNELNITLDELAEDMNTTKATLSRYENDLRVPSADFIKNLADYFNVTTDYLLGTSDIRNPYDDDPNMLPEEFTNPSDAMTFILKQPSVMAYGGYSLDEMSEEEILDFANDILIAIKITLAQRKNK